MIRGVLALKLRLILLFSLLLLSLAPAKQRLEILLEHCRAELLIPIVEARFPGVHLLQHPTTNGFLFDYPKIEANQNKPKLWFHDSTLATKNWIPLVDRPPEAGAGTATREILCPMVSARLWQSYLNYRYPDLIISLHKDDHGFCAVGQPDQLVGAQALIDGL